jgi:hypothetical protein
METELLAFCRKEMGVGGPQEGGGKECGAAAMVVEQEDFTFEAAWDLDAWFNLQCLLLVIQFLNKVKRTKV